MTDQPITLTVNGQRYDLLVDPRWLLVEALREGLRLTGTHIGCLTGDCGACTVRLNGHLVKSCLELAVAADGAEIVTVEGLAPPGQLTPLQHAFWDAYAFQCGYCLPGMLFAAEDLLRQNPRPDEAAIRAALVGNLCRCTGYHNIVGAIQAAAEAMVEPTGTAS